METEFEATFLEIKKDEIRKKLKEIGAKLIKAEFLQKRIAYDLPCGHEVDGAWLRVRDEGDKITMSYKFVKRDSIEISDQKELQIIINNFQDGGKLLELLGCKKLAYQETKRELWKVNNVDVTIDEWPFLEPFIEVEGKSEKEVKAVTKLLGFDYKAAFFGSCDGIYSKKYGIDIDKINFHTPLIKFNMKKNPFIK